MGKKDTANQQQELQEVLAKHKAEVDGLKEQLEKSEASRKKLREHLVGAQCFIKIMGFTLIVRKLPCILCPL